MPSSPRANAGGRRRLRSRASTRPVRSSSSPRTGAKTTGCTVHSVTSEVDGGPILDQAKVPVDPAAAADRRLGLHLVGRLVDEMDYRRTPEGLNRVELAKSF